MAYTFHLPGIVEMQKPENGGIEMLRIMDDDEFKTTLVTGCPGSGKTTLSIYRIIRLNRQDRGVQFVTYHNMLALVIGQAVREHHKTAHSHLVEEPNVSTFHKWYCPLVNSGFKTDAPPTKEEMEQLVAASRLAANAGTELIVDEGQDLPLCVYEVLPKYFQRCFIGADDGQQVHPTHGARVRQIEEVLQRRHSPYRRRTLGRNFRNTVQTYAFARQFVPKTNLVAWDENILDQLKHAKRLGPRPTVIEYADPNARNTHLLTTLRNAKGNVAILCPVGSAARARHSGESVDEMVQIVKQLGQPYSAYHNEMGGRVPKVIENYHITTFKSAKGMEFDEVIIPRVNFFAAIPEQWYVACTRAKNQLFVYRDLAAPQIDPVVDFDPTTYDTVKLNELQSTTPKTAPF